MSANPKYKDVKFFLIAIAFPVCGGIEFGEDSPDRTRREVWEEVGEEITKEKLMTVTENIFTFMALKNMR